MIASEIVIRINILLDDIDSALMQSQLFVHVLQSIGRHAETSNCTRSSDLSIPT